MKRAILVAIAAVSVLSLGLYVFRGGGEEIPVRVMTVGTGEITSTLSATGRVVSMEEAEISASAPGQVKAVYVEEGETVASGALLALLDDREAMAEVEGAQQSVREAEERARQMRRDLEGLAAVYAVGGASRQSVDDSRSVLEMARSAASRARFELAEHQIALDRLKVRAPFDGVVTRRSISPGEWATPGVALFSLAKASLREIEVMVDESDGGLVKTGQEVDLSSDAFPGYGWVEHVTEVALAVRKEGTANSIKVRVSYGTSAPDLKLGQQVDARIRTAHRADAVKLPFDAIINRGGKTFVAMVKDGRIRFVPVVTGIEDAISVEIVSGVSAGQELIAPEGKIHEEGRRVKVIVNGPTR